MRDLYLENHPSALSKKEKQEAVRQVKAAKFKEMMSGKKAAFMLLSAILGLGIGICGVGDVAISSCTGIAGLVAIFSCLAVSLMLLLGMTMKVDKVGMQEVLARHKRRIEEMALLERYPDLKYYETGDWILTGRKEDPQVWLFDGYDTRGRIALKKRRGENWRAIVEIAAMRVAGGVAGAKGERFLSRFLLAPEKRTKKGAASHWRIFDLGKESEEAKARLFNMSLGDRRIREKRKKSGHGNPAAGDSADSLIYQVISATYDGPYAKVARSLKRNVEKRGGEGGARTTLAILRPILSDPSQGDPSQSGPERLRK